VSQVYR